MYKGTIAVFHSQEFRGRFCVVATTNIGQSSAAWYVLLKDDLDMNDANVLASNIRSLLDPITLHPLMHCSKCGEFIGHRHEETCKLANFPN